jgi:hypothetical protein
MCESFCWWPDHENFLQYDVTFTVLHGELVAHRLDRICLDTNCKWVWAAAHEGHWLDFL